MSTTNVTVRNGGVLDVNGSDSAGVVDLEALGGNLNFNGRIRANGIATRMGYGGEIDLFASGSMTVDGPGLDVSGGDLGGAGFLTLEAATGSVNVTSPLKAFGGDGGDIDISAGTTLQTSSAAELNVDANGDAGSGGAIDLSAGGDIVIGGETIGRGSLPDFQMDGRSGGDGADFDVFSNSGSVTINGRITINAAAGGSGGALDFEAAQNLTITKPIIAHEWRSGWHRRRCLPHRERHHVVAGVDRRLGKHRQRRLDRGSTVSGTSPCRTPSWPTATCSAAPSCSRDAR